MSKFVAQSGLIWGAGGEAPGATTPGARRREPQHPGRAIQAVASRPGSPATHGLPQPRPTPYRSQHVTERAKP